MNSLIWDIRESCYQTNNWCKFINKHITRVSGYLTNTKLGNMFVHYMKVDFVGFILQIYPMKYCLRVIKTLYSIIVEHQIVDKTWYANNIQFIWLDSSQYVIDYHIVRLSDWVICIRLQYQSWTILVHIWLMYSKNKDVYKKYKQKVYFPRIKVE